MEIIYPMFEGREDFRRIKKKINSISEIKESIVE